MGLEPIRPFGHQPLKLARLPNSITSACGGAGLTPSRMPDGNPLGFTPSPRYLYNNNEPINPSTKPLNRGSFLSTAVV
jgi:hypothetical protein